MTLVGWGLLKLSWNDFGGIFTFISTFSSTAWEQSVVPPQTLRKARAQPKGVNTRLSLGELYCFHTEMSLGEWPGEAHVTPGGTRL